MKIQTAISCLHSCYDDISHFEKVATMYYRVIRVPQEDEYVLCLLHDIIEDGKSTFDEIESIFGDKMASYCEILDHHRFGDYKDYVSACLESYYPVRVVKICDFLANYLTLLSLPRDKRIKLKAKYDSVSGIYVSSLKECWSNSTFKDVNSLITDINFTCELQV